MLITRAYGARNGTWCQCSSSERAMKTSLTKTMIRFGRKNVVDEYDVMLDSNRSQRHPYKMHKQILVGRHLQLAPEREFGHTHQNLS